MIDRLEAQVADGDRDGAVREFLHDIAGYEESEIDELRKSPVWELRKAVAHTLPRELRAECDYELNRAALAELDIPVLMLIGGESPDWARRSTAAYSEAASGRHRAHARGPGPRRAGRGP